MAEEIEGGAPEAVVGNLYYNRAGNTLFLMLGRVEQPPLVVGAVLHDAFIGLERHSPILFVDLGPVPLIHAEILVLLRMLSGMVAMDAGGVQSLTTVTVSHITFNRGYAARWSELLSQISGL